MAAPTGGAAPPALKRPRTESGGSPPPADDGGTDTTAATTLRVVADGLPPHESRPLFTHQVFDDERVAGYEGLAITVTINATTAHSHVHASYASRAPDAPDVVAALVGALDGASGDEKAFAAAVAATPPLDVAALGTPLATGAGKSGDVAIYCVQLASAPAPVKAVHARLSSLLTFFIDGASPIDADDPDWDLLLALHVPSNSDGGAPVRVAGFATLYRMYGWPTATRLRVCQVAVLPPSAGSGVGWALLEAAYGLADARACLDVTFEDPTDEMQGMRERLEARRAAACGWLADAARAAAAGLAAAAKGKAAAAASAPAFPSLPPDDVARARTELRIAKQQVAPAFEALVAAAAGPSAAAAVRAAVRARLAASVASADARAGDKRVFNDPAGGAGFVMCRAARGGAGAPPAEEAPAEEEGVAEQNAAAVEEATELRMEALERVVAGLVV